MQRSHLTWQQHEYLLWACSTPFGRNTLEKYTIVLYRKYTKLIYQHPRYKDSSNTALKNESVPVQDTGLKLHREIKDPPSRSEGICKVVTPESSMYYTTDSTSWNLKSVASSLKQKDKADTLLTVAHKLSDDETITTGEDE